MRTWWQGRSERERLLLALAAGALLLLSFYLWVWEPLQQELRGLRQSVEQQSAELAWMRSAAGEVRRLQSRAAAAASSMAAPAADNSSAAGGPSLLTLVDQTAKLAGLGSVLKRLEPQGRDRLRVQMEQVGFDALLLWLTALQNEHGLILVNAVMNRQTMQGRVDARLILQR